MTSRIEEQSNEGHEVVGQTAPIDHRPIALQQWWQELSHEQRTSIDATLRRLRWLKWQAPAVIDLLASDATDQPTH